MINSMVYINLIETKFGMVPARKAAYDLSNLYKKKWILRLNQMTVAHERMASFLLFEYSASFFFSHS